MIGDYLRLGFQAVNRCLLLPYQSIELADLSKYLLDSGFHFRIS